MSKTEKESALVVALRALVMLGSLVALPYLAISDGLLTEELLQGAISTLHESISQSVQTASPTTERPDANSEPPIYRLSGFQDRGMQESIDRVILPARASVSLVDHRSEIPESSRSVGNPEASETTEEVERRLQALGAVAYHLEKWGVENRMYRFVCEVAIEDHRHVRRHFEALGQTPLLAMQQVLEEVRARTDGLQDGRMSASSASGR